MSAIKKIFEDDNLLVKYKKGSGDIAIFSFTGVGHALGGIDIQREEFSKSLLVDDVTLFFIIDKKRSWGNSIDFDFLVKLVSPLLNDKKIYCLGNSMGAFNAVIFSYYFKTDVCLGFVPQYSVNKNVVKKEDRWDEYVVNIDEYKYKELNSFYFRDSTKYIFFSGSHYKERRHWAKLPSNKNNVFNYVVDGAKHNVAQIFKEKGVLRDVISLSFFCEDDFDFDFGFDLVGLKVFRHFSS